jgi:glutamate racemase
MGRPRSGASILARASFSRRSGAPAYPGRFAVHRHALPDHASRGCRHYSQISARNDKGTPQTLPTRQEIIDSIAHHRTPSPYPPRPFDHGKATHNYPEATQLRIKALDSLISEIAQAANKRPVRSEYAGSLLTAFNALAGAGKIFVCTGANTADGKVDTDGPIGAAVLANALYQAGKVAIVVADQTNCNLVQDLIQRLDPDCGRHLRYIPVSGVNGILVESLCRLIEKHGPDAVMHVGVPGRTRDGLYLDAHGSYIGEYNVALDQLLDLANALGHATVAIGTGPHQAGLGNTSNGSVESARTTLHAQHQVLAGSVTIGAVALAEMLSAAYGNTQACTPELLKAMLKLARECRNKPDYAAHLVREGSAGHTNKAARLVPDAQSLQEEASDKSLRYASLAGLMQIHERIHAAALAWPQEIEEARLYGRTCRFVAVVDSSEGGRIAAGPFRNFVRARSPLDLRILCVSDDANAPYGTKADEARHDMVYRMLRYTARQGTEVIVMMCNTACLEDLRSIKKRIEQEARDEERSLTVHIIDLIDTTAMAIVARGGARPVLLSTEATAIKGRYPEKIDDYSQGQSEQPDVLVIAAGNKNDPELKELDWATLINKGYHRMRQNPRIMALLRTEIRRYVDRIPLDSTSVWLCCTHFPAVQDLIEKILAERLTAFGYSHRIPVHNPVADQADALIAWSKEFPPSCRNEFARQPLFTVQSTAPVIDIVEGVSAIFPPETVITRVNFDARKPHGTRRSKARGDPDMSLHAVTASELGKDRGDHAGPAS